LGRLITGFNPATDTITFSPALPFAIQAGDSYEIFPGHQALLANFAHGGTSATFALKRLEVINADAEAVFIQSTEAASAAMKLLGAWGGLWVQGGTEVAAAFTCGSSRGIYIEGGPSSPAVLTSGDVEANITGNLSGSVASVTGNVGGDLGGALTTAERNAIADALLGRSDGIETGITPRQALRAIAAVVAGLITTSQEAQEIFKALGATSSGTTRVTLTVDSEGNRSAVTLDL
jgi:hypothetical protein